MEYVCRLGHMDENVLSSIHEYFRSVVLPYVEENCGSEDAFDSFLKIVKENIHSSPPPLKGREATQTN